MGKKSIAGILMAAALMSGDRAAANDKNHVADRRTIILFGASWCAPCQTELRQLPALATAAAPDGLTVAWIDRPPPSRLVTDNLNVSVLSAGEAGRKFRAIVGENQGLPVSVILEGSRVCGIRRRPLTLQSLQTLRNSC